MSINAGSAMFPDKLIRAALRVQFHHSGERSALRCLPLCPFYFLHLFDLLDLLDHLWEQDEINRILSIRHKNNRIE